MLTGVTLPNINLRLQHTVKTSSSPPSMLREKRRLREKSEEKETVKDENREGEGEIILDLSLNPIHSDLKGRNEGDEESS